MHSKGIVLFSRMTRAYFRRWCVYCIEQTLKLGFAMACISVGGVLVALFIGKCLELLGVAYG